MATKLSNIDIEIAHFNNIKKYLPDSEKWCWNTVDHLLSLGLIQVSSAVEHAIANISGTTVVSENKYDLANGDEIKIATVRLRDRGKSYDAHISNTKGKSGNLKVQVYERKTQKFYYFIIPYRKYSKITYLEIPFNLDGTPKYKNHWWDNEVKTFEDLAKN